MFYKKPSAGFTIVELVIVIVVIGILAAVTIVAYNGVTRSAAQATLQSDLRNAQAQIAVAKETTSTYPANTDAIKASPGTTYEYDATATSYCITASSEAAQTSFFFDSTAGVIEEGTCPGHSGLGGGTPPEPILATGRFTSGNYTCSSIEGVAYCWGLGSSGRLGNNGTSNSLVPVPVVATGALSGRTVSSISSGNIHTCAIADGAAFCWGFQNAGQLGDGTTTTSLVPVAVSTSGVLAGLTISAISAGSEHTCVVANSQAYCWGSNGGSSGMLGNDSSTNSSVPVAVSTAGVLAGRSVTAISTGVSFTCAIADALPYCWGSGSFSRLGNNSSLDSRVPVAVSTSGVLAGRSITKISTGTSHTCVIADDLPFCWGSGGNGRLGNNATSDAPVPVAVSPSGVLAGRTITDISSGAGHTCAVADGEAFCWGTGSAGRLGNNGTTDALVPVAVSTSGVLSGRTVTSISAGAAHSCAVADGEMFCWGSGFAGQLGNNGTSSSNVPVAVSPI